jgi:hypothetical protein
MNKFDLDLRHAKRETCGQFDLVIHQLEDVVKVAAGDTLLAIRVFEHEAQGVNDCLNSWSHCREMLC